MRRRTFLGVALAAIPLAAASRAGEQTQDERLEERLEYRLDTLESRARPQRTPRTSDLLTDSDLRAGQQDLRTLKTREPTARSVPRLELQLDRMQRGRAPRNPLLRPGER